LHPARYKEAMMETAAIKYLFAMIYISSELMAMGAFNT
jgi:hypothetical protein